MIRIAKDPPMQASKWLQLQALLEVSEIQSLLEQLTPCKLYVSGHVCRPGEEVISLDAFLSVYANYIKSLKSGITPNEQDFREVFSAAISVTEDAIYAYPLPDGRQIMRVCQPIIQMQVHRMSYSKAEGKFRPMVHGSESILWGIQFAYPQLFQDPKTKEPVTVSLDQSFENTPYFRKLQQWIRHSTIPTPFLIDGKRVNIPMRIGRLCLPWINQHPQLVQQNLVVKII